MDHMFKKMVFSALVLSLISCTARISENKFIAQSESVTPAIDLPHWKNAFPSHHVERLTLTTTNSSAKLQGLLLDNPNSQDVIFFIPGNGMTITKAGMKAFKRLVDLNTDIVFFDRRGLGASNGQATIANLITDSVEKLNYIRDKLQPDTIIVHGFSLGSFIAGQLAKSEKMDALVLEGAATNVDDWIDKSVPWYTKPFLTIEIDPAFDTVDNKLIVSEHYSGPLLIIGGEDDEQVPVELSVALFNASQSSHKKLMIVDDATHGSMLDNSAEIVIYQQFLAAMKSH